MWNNVHWKRYYDQGCNKYTHKISCKGREIIRLGPVLWEGTQKRREIMMGENLTEEWIVWSIYGYPRPEVQHQEDKITLSWTNSQRNWQESQEAQTKLEEAHMFAYSQNRAERAGWNWTGMPGASFLPTFQHRFQPQSSTHPDPLASWHKQPWGKGHIWWKAHLKGTKAALYQSNIWAKWEQSLLGLMEADLGNSLGIWTATGATTAANTQTQTNATPLPCPCTAPHWVQDVGTGMGDSTYLKGIELTETWTCRLCPATWTIVTPNGWYWPQSRGESLGLYRTLPLALPPPPISNPIFYQSESYSTICGKDLDLSLSRI